MKNVFFSTFIVLAACHLLALDSSAEETQVCAAVVPCDGHGGILPEYIAEEGESLYCELIYREKCQIEHQYAMAEELSVCEASNIVLAVDNDRLKKRNKRIRTIAQRRFRALQRHNLLPRR